MAERKFGSEGEKIVEKTLSPEEVKEGVKVTWTREGIERSYGDAMDAALVKEGEILTIVSKYDKEKNSVMIKNKNGAEFPANLKYLKEIK